MFSQTLTIARNTFVESVRQPIYFIIIAICALFTLFTTWSAAFSMGLSESGEVSGDNKLLLDVGLATVFVCGTLLAAFVATAVLSREIENKTVLTVVSKPVARPTVVFGKYLGAAAALVIAVVTMLLFLQMGIRHQVLSTAADTVDGPVVVFTLLAVGLALGIGIWCNFFYGWVFTQTTTLLLFPLMIAAYVAVLLVGKKWNLQPIATDFKPQIALASVCIVLAQLVLTAIATAASARLGQVMTLVICCGVFVLGLLSNHFVGRRAVHNEFVARVVSSEPDMPSYEGLLSNGDTYSVRLEQPPRAEIRPGSPVYYGPNPGGLGLVNRYTDAAPVDPAVPATLSDRDRSPAVVAMSVAERELQLRRVGRDGPAVARPPEEGDYLFLRPTRINPPMYAAWGVVPNVQFFWLVDAITQNQPIPASHVGLVALYALTQIGVFLSLAILLFQKREVG